ncbi:DUF3225 domain-containing protein [Paraburkholderia sp. SARCC-3016]|uniref:AtzH-like domain-containing protein n=1 Tax=Paraburkholderia sp. SARCC-3016 TaxID=3058611 RepID=UPI002806BA8D|nr:AtzH-like domain-containing protein [Paraburkholderia sp. SARCC-3016]MDQ7982125.1 DUF3225 domain-containing protein [Paraburkholderia sp. SARCC-3016]
MNINMPHVVDEVAAVHSTYEKALVENDVFLLNALIWENPNSVCYGFDDMYYGSSEIRKLNASRHPISNGTMTTSIAITTFGYDTATVSTEFSCDDPEFYGRRTVVWARVGPDSQPEAGLHGGWRVVASHDSAVSRRPCI